MDADRFIDHLEVMFGEDHPPWDKNRTYTPHALQVCVCVCVCVCVRVRLHDV